MLQTDFLIIGAGVVGLSIARELKLRHPQVRVIVLEKESSPGRHSSGRNSGVLHSGIYYPPDSLKAKVCRQGAIEMAEYHEANGLRLEKRGKVLVAVSEYDAPQLELLATRAKQNGIEAEELDEKALRALEPEARSATGNALWIPSTSVGSPQDMMRIIHKEVQQQGVEFLYGEKLTFIHSNIRTATLSNGTTISYGHAINAAGLHADTVAHLFGVGKRYTLLPFKGIYWKLDPLSGLKINHLIYPVPDLRVPFLGVHTTTTTDGSTYLGPTAVPAFARENYHGVQNITATELIRITYLLGRQFLQGHNGFRRLAWQEGRRYFKPWFTQAAQAILPRLKTEHLMATEKVGIRAQMLDKETGNLVSDFLIERSQHSTHILNAISPAWTSAFPFARHVVDGLV